MFDGLRVLDLTDERGQLAAMVLASVGADVVLAEPPDGSPARRLAPFAGDVADVERSAWHLAFNRGKRAVTVDRLDPTDGALLALIAGADVVIESAPPGTFRWDELVAATGNRGLVLVSITPFGQTGPKAGYAATDLVIEASACELALNGDPERPPVRVSVPQAYLNAALDAAYGAMVAVWERARTGRGQHVDVSAQESTAMITQGLMLAAAYEAPLPQRVGAGVKVGPIHLRWVFRCADGYVTNTLLLGPHAPFLRRLLDWMIEEGDADPALRAVDWEHYVQLRFDGAVDGSELDELQDRIDAFCLRRSKAELLAGGLTRRVLFAPCASVDELYASEQLAARGYWAEVDGLRLPGPFADAPGVLRPLGRAPRLGEHDVATVTAAWTPRQPPLPFVAPDLRRAPLEGVKVVDLTWFMAGPATTRMLADWGATVVRVESARRPHGGRGSGPHLRGEAGPDNGGYGLTHNSGKLGLALDLSRPESRPVLEDLLRWADVFVINYSPRAVRSMDLEASTLLAINPGLVAVSTCLMGQTGPLAELAGFGNLSAAIAGFYELTGWPDLPPVGPLIAYTDVVAPRFTACAILAALAARDRTGEGSVIDLSQAEASLWLLSPALVDAQANGRVPRRVGNDDPNHDPHGVFATAQDGRWVAVACATEEQRAALAAVLGAAGGPGSWNGAVAAWCARRSAEEVEACLQAVGVPAHAVNGPVECWADPQLHHRGQFQRLAHPVHGEVIVQGPRLRFSRSETPVRRAAPPIGEDTFLVLSELLGYDSDRIADLAAAEVLE